MSKRGRNIRDQPTIPEFFSGKSVFITGGTGFIGKVLIEKILRSCPQVEKIYLLLRSKKNKTLEERVKDMTSLPIFVKIKRQDDAGIEKIVPVKGDVSELNLGLSEEDRQMLINEVSIVFHVAASVRFDDPLKKAILMNTRGTYEMVKLAQKMKNLEAFVHVSTAYCNTHKDVIEEIIYPPPADWREIIKLAENIDIDTLEVFCGKILGFYPNTYTYTKGLAEHVILDHAHMIPAVIFRPTIVVSSFLEPLPGWVDNFNGPVGLMVASGKGLVRTLYSDPDICADYVPVDVTVKAMIAAAWNRGTSDDDFSELPVYNCSANDIKRISQREMVALGTYVTEEVPFNDILWIPNPTVTKWKWLHYVKVFLFHFLPALVFDTVLKISKRKPILMKIHRKIFVANLALEYFLTKHWSFKHDRCFALNGKLLEEDAPQFSYVPTSHFDIIEYYRNSAFGGREYLLHEDNVDLPEARRHQRRMYWIDKITKIAFLAVITYLSVKFQVISKIRSFVYLAVMWMINV